MFKHLGIGAAIVLAGALSVFVYLGERAADPAAAGGSSADEKSGGSVPWLNDRLYHARGNALFKRGADRLTDVASRDSDFGGAYRNYLRSLALHPFSPTTHFDFGQLLQYLNALGSPVPERYFDEYRKAAVLSGTDTAIYFEVGKILLARWPGLSPDERRFAQEIIRTLLSRKSPWTGERLDLFLNLWELNVREPAVLKRILPAEAEPLRRAAGFLGEKGIFLEARLTFLAEAERLDFRTASGEETEGRLALRTARPDEALQKYRAAKERLEGIRFYQSLAPDVRPVPEKEYRDLTRAVRLGILECRLAAAEPDPKVILDDVRVYLEAEDGVGAVADLESLLETRGLIEKGSRPGFLDFDRLSLSMELAFKQNKFREVVLTGQTLKQNLLVVPEDRRPAAGRMFELVGDAHQRLDDLYESSAFYEKAIELGAPAAVVRIKMRRNYERLNRTREIVALQARIDGGLTARETALGGTVWAAGEPYSAPLVLDETIYLLRVEFSDDLSASPLLVSVEANGRILSETFLESGSLEAEFPAQLGRNVIKITPVNRSCLPVRMILSPREKAPVPPSGKTSPSERPEGRT